MISEEHRHARVNGETRRGAEAPPPPHPSESVGQAELRRLLRCLFEDGLAASRFVVLRNGESLPDALSGTDLDVATLPGCPPSEVVELIARRGRSAGWELVCVSRRPHMTGFALAYCAGPGPPQAIHFDVFDGITFLGLPLVSCDVLQSESFVHCGVRQLSGRGRALATTVHHLAWNGRLQKEKYRTELDAVLAAPADREWLLRHVDRALGPWVAAELGGLVDPSRLGRATLLRRWGIARGIWVRWVAPQSVLTCRRMVRYVAGQLDSLLHPPGIVGCPGNRIPGVAGARLSAELACRIAPHGFAADSVRGSVCQTKTLNGPRYEASLAVLWKRWTLLRWLLPSLFLWVQAKRNRVAVVGRLPVGLRILRRTRWGAGWVAVEDNGTATRIGDPER